MRHVLCEVVRQRTNGLLIKSLPLSPVDHPSVCPVVLKCQKTSLLSLQWRTTQPLSLDGPADLQLLTGSQQAINWKGPLNPTWADYFTFLGNNCKCYFSNIFDDLMTHFQVTLRIRNAGGLLTVYSSNGGTFCKSREISIVKFPSFRLFFFHFISKNKHCSGQKKTTAHWLYYEAADSRWWKN